MLLPATAIYGSLNALLNIFLASRVSGHRVQHKIAVGTGDNKALEIAARVHGNNAEFVPLAILLLLIAELMQLNSVVLHSVGGSLFVARLLHAYGMPRPAPNFGRFVGTAVTWIIIAGMAFWILIVGILQG